MNKSEKRGGRITVYNSYPAFQIQMIFVSTTILKSPGDQTGT
ncbi:MAG: hypothetical protein V4553_00495 [Bacteroidota bacterium]